MANTKSAGKRARQTTGRTSRNRRVLSRLGTLTKRAADGTAESINATISAIDKAAKRGILHRNAANRRKAKLNRSRAGAAAK